ncbi:MAG: hypothetical protein A2W36_06105 [Chloroflexi bacterium RBG_16_58_14]|nr:MAG: hypothetical protein A2W36_06105 [Chloroflexi bacterium RBG_16_58_14]
MSGGFRCKEHAGGLTDLEDIAFAFAPVGGGEDITIKRPLESSHGILRLGFPSWAELDDLTREESQQDKQISFESRLCFIFAGLSRELNHDGIPMLVNNRVDDSLDDLRLVRSELDLRTFGREGTRVI